MLLVVVVLDVVLLVFVGDHSASVVHHSLTDIHAHICNDLSIDAIQNDALILLILRVIGHESIVK